MVTLLVSSLLKFDLGFILLADMFLFVMINQGLALDTSALTAAFTLADGRSKLSVFILNMSRRVQKLATNRTGAVYAEPDVVSSGLTYRI